MFRIRMKVRETKQFDANQKVQIQDKSGKWRDCKKVSNNEYIQIKIAMFIAEVFSKN